MGYESEMDGCGRFMKYTLFVVNFIIFLGGLLTIGVSSYALAENVDYISDLTGYNILAGSIYVLLGSGIVITVIAFLGCYGAMREIKCMLFMYFILVMLLFVIILIGGVLGYVFREKFALTLKQQMKNSLKLYDENKDVTYAWDKIQSKLHCCGVDSFRDWQQYLNKIPKSCCQEFLDGQQIRCERDPTQINNSTTYTWGCFEQTKSHMEKHSAIIGGVGLGVAALMLLGMIFSCALFKLIH